MLHSAQAKLTQTEEQQRALEQELEEHRAAIELAEAELAHHQVATTAAAEAASHASNALTSLMHSVHGDAVGDATSVSATLVAAAKLSEATASTSPTLNSVPAPQTAAAAALTGSFALKLNKIKTTTKESDQTSSANDEQKDDAEAVDVVSQLATSATASTSILNRPNLQVRPLVLPASPNISPLTPAPVSSASPTLPSPSSASSPPPFSPGGLLRRASTMLARFSKTLAVDSSVGAATETPTTPTEPTPEATRRSFVLGLVPPSPTSAAALQQVSSLQQQTATAFETAAARIAILKKELLASIANETSLRDRVTSLESQLSSATTRAAEVAAETQLMLSTAATEKKTLSMEKHTFETQLGGLRAEYDLQGKALAVANERESAASKQVETLMVQVTQLEASREQLHTSYYKNTQSMLTLQETKTALDSQVAAMGVELATSKANLSSANGQLASMTQSHSDIQSQYEGSIFESVSLLVSVLGFICLLYCHRHSR